MSQKTKKQRGSEGTAKGKGSERNASPRSSDRLANAEGSERPADQRTTVLPGKNSTETPSAVPSTHDTDPTLAVGADERDSPQPGFNPLDAPTARSSEAVDSDSIPDRIGDYTILRKLGEGGMGVVYEAEQQNPRRRVALKVVRGGRLVDEATLKMFQREAETLALLKHPNIASIYESGRTEDGHHFFAMELIQGDTLSQYLKRPSMESGDVDELHWRLGLVRRICEAVNYAHQRGVIHRDLKPSNIVVVEQEPGSGSLNRESAASGPEIKILDFGLARITDTDVAATTVVTELGAIKGTLPYMSPEQARGVPQEIDLRTDVYSIGVMLYELISGQLPYDTASGSILEGARIICEQEPKPLRQTWSGVRRLDSDIETIVLKALEKDSGRRYQSASALGEDIERFLASQPILARPPSAVYQLKKLISRNRLAFGLSVAVAVLLVGFGISMSLLYAQSERNLDRALKAESAAEDRAENADEVSEFFAGLLAPAGADSMERLAVESMLQRGEMQLEGGLSDRPEARTDALRRLGRLYGNLGRFDRAVPLTERAMEDRGRILGPSDPELADDSEDLGRFYLKVGRFADAESLLERSIEIRREVHGLEHREVEEATRRIEVIRTEEWSTALAESLSRAAVELQNIEWAEIEKIPGAAPWVKMGVGIAADVLGMFSGNDSIHVVAAPHPPLPPHVPAAAARKLVEKARVARAKDRPRRAEALYRAAVTMLRETEMDRTEKAAVMRELAAWLQETGRGSEAGRLRQAADRLARGMDPSAIAPETPHRPGASETVPETPERTGP